MLFIGIDWADSHHDVSIVNDQGLEIKRFQISHCPEGFSQLLEKVRNLAGDSTEVSFCLEKPHGLLVDFLLSQNFQIYPVNPKSAERMRDRYSSSMKKDDAFDAFVLADALRTDRHRLSPLIPDSELARELKALVQDREELVRIKTRALNQISACLKEYYPVALKIFSEIQSEIALDFLTSYPTPEALQQMTLKAFTRFLDQRHYPWKMLKRTPEGFYQEVQGLKLLKADPVVIKTKSRFLLALLDQLRALVHQVKQYDRAIAEAMAKHPDNDIFSGLPGAGKALAPKLAAHFGEDRNRFKNFESVQRYSGTAPITKKSGNYKYVQRRHACQTGFQNTLFQYAFVTLKKCLWARKYYEEKRKSGNTHAAALRALANKWAKIIYALWKNHQCYQETIFLAARQQHALLNAS